MVKGLWKCVNFFTRNWRISGCQASALSDRIRLDIVQTLLRDPTEDCSTLYADMPKSTRSHHFRILLCKDWRASHRTTLRCEELNSRSPGLLDAIAKSNARL